MMVKVVMTLPTKIMSKRVPSESLNKQRASAGIQSVHFMPAVCTSHRCSGRGAGLGVRRLGGLSPAEGELCTHLLVFKVCFLSPARRGKELNFRVWPLNLLQSEQFLRYNHSTDWASEFNLDQRFAMLLVGRGVQGRGGGGEKVVKNTAKFIITNW